MTTKNPSRPQDPIPRDALAELLGQLAGLKCFWKTRPQPALGADGGPQAWLELALHSSRTVGQAEYRTGPNPKNANAYIAAVRTYDLATITIRARSFESSSEPSALLGAVRAGLRSMTAKAVYQREKIAFVRTMPQTFFTSTYKGRTLLEGTMDWTFAVRGGGVVHDDPGLTIATVNGNTGIPVTVK